MAEAKVGPKLQCNKLQRDDLDHYKQPLQQRRRGHGITYNVPTTNRFKEERAHKLIARQKDMLCCSDFLFQQQKMRKLDGLRGVWPVDTPNMCRVYERGGFMCDNAKR